MSVEVDQKPQPACSGGFTDGIRFERTAAEERQMTLMAQHDRDLYRNLILDVIERLASLPRE